MLNRFSPSKRWIYPLLTIAMVLTLSLGQPLVARAISWADLIRSGIQAVQLANLSDRQEVQLGQQINAELVGRQVRLHRGASINQYVNEIGQRLAAQSSRPQIPYTFQVVDDNSVNAFATMGGFVYVNTGLLRLAENEAQLASVMAHEIGHIAGRHAVNQMKEMAIASGAAGALGVNRNAAVSIGVDLALRRPNSRQSEYEADQLGLRTLSRAGYSESAMVDFMGKLLRQSAVPTFLSTHPATNERINRLRQALQASPSGGAGLDTAAYRSRIRTLL